jgi:hypothetical protein
LDASVSDFQSVRLDKLAGCSLCDDRLADGFFFGIGAGCGEVAKLDTDSIANDSRFFHSDMDEIAGHW